MDSRLLDGCIRCFFLNHPAHRNYKVVIHNGTDQNGCAFDVGGTGPVMGSRGNDNARHRSAHRALGNIWNRGVLAFMHPLQSDVLPASAHTSAPFVSVRYRGKGAAPRAVIPLDFSSTLQVCPFRCGLEAGVY